MPLEGFARTQLLSGRANEPTLSWGQTNASSNANIALRAQCHVCFRQLRSARLAGWLLPVEPKSLKVGRSRRAKAQFDLLARSPSCPPAHTPFTPARGCGNGTWPTNSIGQTVVVVVAALSFVRSLATNWGGHKFSSSDSARAHLCKCAGAKLLHQHWPSGRALFSLPAHFSDFGRQLARRPGPFPPLDSTRLYPKLWIFLSLSWPIQSPWPLAWGY